MAGFLISPEESPASPFQRLTSPVGEFFVPSSELDRMVANGEYSELSASVSSGRFQSFPDGSCFVIVPGTPPGQALTYKINNGNWQEGVITVSEGEGGLLLLDCSGASEIYAGVSFSEDDLKITKYRVP